MDKKILVVYYSLSGNTERVARDVAAKLNADLEKLTDKKDRSGFLGYFGAGKDATLRTPAELGEVQKDPAAYDLVVMGTPVWAWTMAPALRAYIMKYRDKCAAVAFFTTAGGTEPARIVAAMETLAGKKALASAGFTQKKELRDAAAYTARMNDFIAALTSLERR
jgi:flavodoxin